jgi:hypothetical protein
MNEIKVGNNACLDKGCANESTVQVVWLGEYIAKVKDDNDTWATMLYRLTPLDDE